MEYVVRNRISLDLVRKKLEQVGLSFKVYYKTPLEEINFYYSENKFVKPYFFCIDVDLTPLEDAINNFSLSQGEVENYIYGLLKTAELETEEMLNEQYR